MLEINFDNGLIGKFIGEWWGGRLGVRKCCIISVVVVVDVVVGCLRRCCVCVLHLRHGDESKG